MLSFNLVDFFINFFFRFKIRLILIFLSSFFFSFLFNFFLISFFNKKKFFQFVRNNNIKKHSLKKNIPTMGGIPIVISITLSLILFSKLDNFNFFLILFSLIGFGIVGFIDDLMKVKFKNLKGLSVYMKYILQSLLSLIIIFSFYKFNKNIFFLDFLKNLYLLKNFSFLSLELLSFFLFYLILVGSSNAVNLTDGLDGLAIVPVIFISLSFFLVSFITGDPLLSKYFNIFYIDGSKEFCLVCLSIVGSGLGFLCFNSYPAKIFMGDVGSLSLGSLLGLISISLKQEIFFFLLVLFL